MAIRRACCFDAVTGEPVDSLVAQRVTPPWPVPSDCAASRQVLQQPSGFAPGYFVSGQTMSVGGTQNLYFQGDNFVFILTSPRAVGTTPRLETSSKGGQPTARASLENLQQVLTTTSGVTYSFTTLRLTEPGCWKVKISAGPASLEYTLYAYPSECRPEASHTPLPPGITSRPCVKP